MKLFNVIEYGVISGVEKIQTKKIQNVIDLAAKCGGRVYFPSGIYHSGTLQLFSNMVLELEKGAMLVASRDYEDYHGNGRYNSELGEVVSFLYALETENLTVCGDGVIDCQGDAFAYMDQPRPTLHRDIDISEMTKEQIADSVVEFTEPRPNQLLYFQNCKNLEIKGVTIKDAPCWTIVLNKCVHSKFHNIIIQNDQRLCNSDGIHICGCTDIEIYNNTFICGDDCVAITGILDWEAFNNGIYVHDCTFSSRSAAIRIGHCLSKNKNVKISNIRIENSNRALVLNSEKNSVLENVLIENVVMETRIHCGAWWGNAEALSLRNANGIMTNVVIKNISGTVENGLFLTGNLSGVKIENVALTVKYGKNRPLFDKGIDFQPNLLKAKDNDNEVYSIYKRDVCGLQIGNVSINKSNGANFNLIEKEESTTVEI